MGGEPKIRILIVDDEAVQREMLAGLLQRSGFIAKTAADGQEGLEVLEQEDFDVALVDQKMPRLDGLQLLESVQRSRPFLPVILMTAFGSVSDAVSAMKLGAADYLTKPFEREELMIVLGKVLRQRRLEDEVRSLRGAFRGPHRLGGLIGRSPAMQEVFSLIERVARADTSVLIRGESGTGKELVARAIHAGSRRADRPFVALNCAAIPESLLESEFFGHEKGAFTGALQSRPGRFEQADGGTLFLDEIGAMRVDLQAKLLRVIQEREVQRLGCDRTRPVDVRILAATSDDLESAIRERCFREDLFYRLNVVPISLPPLRERAEDIPLLALHFLDQAARRLERPAPRLAPELLERLQRHGWPGNVRELQNGIECLVVLAEGDELRSEHLPASIMAGSSPRPNGGLEDFDLPATGVSLPDLERHLILQALERTRGSIGPAARCLGISYKTLQYRIQKHGIRREDFCQGEAHSFSIGN
ncbi:MAG: sigma-54 dependent transcriptional regulator [Planctomycetota bacterium]